MKISVFTDSFLPGSGGTEIATLSLCKGLLALGHKVILFAPDYHREQSFTEFPVYRLKSIKLTDNDMGALSGLEFKRVLKITREFSPDIIYFCSASGLAECAVKAGQKLHKPVVANIHTKFKEAFYRSTKSKLITRFMINLLVKRLDKADKVLTVSHDMAAQLHAYGYKKEVTVIRNGTDQIKLNVSAEDGNYTKPDICGRTVNFIYCGHIIKLKNIDFTVKSLKILKEKYGFSDFKFILVGKGNYEKKLRKLIKKCGLTDNAVFKGYIKDRTELSRIYRQCDLLLFPSTFDTDGLIICEAAQVGTPTLSLKNYGSGERITDNVNGFTAENDVEKYAEKIYGIITDNGLFSSVCKNVNTLRTDTWLETAEKFERVFKELIK